MTDKPSVIVTGGTQGIGRAIDAREFLSLGFLAHLLAKGILFSARLKSDAIIEHNGQRKSAAEWFQAYQRKRPRNAVVYGGIVNVWGRRLKKKSGKQDYLIVVTNLEPDVEFCCTKHGGSANSPSAIPPVSTQAR
jgi:NAD(P)-dependent dehydrogenase (short-subunit alcohol dehydrogenase family)